MTTQPTSRGPREPEIAQPVTLTHWADSDLRRMDEFMAALPSVLEGNFALWQMRVDRGEETPHVPHTRLFIVTASEYARTGITNGRGRSEPTGKSFAMLVCADSSKSAFEKARAQLTAHGLSADSYALHTSGESLLCLA